MGGKRENNYFWNRKNGQKIYIGFEMELLLLLLLIINPRDINCFLDIICGFPPKNIVYYDFVYVVIASVYELPVIK